MVMRNKDKVFATVGNSSKEATQYSGVTTETAEVVINQKTKEIAVNVNFNDYYTKKETWNLIPSIDQFIANIPEQYVTEEELENQGYCDEEAVNRILSRITCIDGGIVE